MLCRQNIIRNHLQARRDCLQNNDKNTSILYKIYIVILSYIVLSFSAVRRIYLVFCHRQGHSSPCSISQYWCTTVIVLIRLFHFSLHTGKDCRFLQYYSTMYYLYYYPCIIAVFNRTLWLMKMKHDARQKIMCYSINYSSLSKNIKLIEYFIRRHVNKTCSSLQIHIFS